MARGPGRTPSEIGRLCLPYLAPSAGGRQTHDRCDRSRSEAQRSGAAGLPVAGASTCAVHRCRWSHPQLRFEVEGVTYLVSGGGGARPYEVERYPEDRYRSADLVNFHYILFRLDGKQLHAAMCRLPDQTAGKPQWQARDTFLITAR